MQMSAGAYVNQGFDVMRPILSAYVGQEMLHSIGPRWWQDRVLTVLSEVYTRNLPRGGEWDKLVDSLDVSACFQIIDRNWNELFKYKMTLQQRNWVKELLTTRNDWAHESGSGLSADDGVRALDTMTRLMEPIDQESAEEIRKLMRKLRDQEEATHRESQSPVTPSAPSSPAYSYARPWRQIAEPHPDVSKGTYRQAEFAADLSQVLRGTAMPEYQDPVEFFARTYITAGMKSMLTKAVQRVASKGGEPVIQLKTAFGGGKTHSMLALYHLMRAVSPMSLKGIPEILNSAGISTMPKVKVAVLVGTFLEPAKQRRPINFPGITINTLWGEMTAQLAEQANNPKLYDLIKESDKKGISPGSDTLCNVLDDSGPCLILIDELVAYARKLYGYKQGDIPAGTFENVLSFVQELTEAARASKNSIVVASIPESETEAGGEAGMIALERVERTFGRMEAVWKPVVAEEGFEIVRRRLFRDLSDKNAVDRVCNAYFEMYCQHPDDFPVECHETEYLTKMKKCYPIHPEVFDRLYNDWATLESFQRTRGVLRFMAAVIHELYASGDSGSMIMPGSIPLGKTQIREELTRYLSPGWDTIIENEVDGRHSAPVTLDDKNTYYSKYFASSRVARTIFLGSAPDVRAQRTRGINMAHIHLGAVQPEENMLTYNDALSRLANELTYLYSSADYRYWYDTRPTLKKTVADRARMQNSYDTVSSLEKVLKVICRNKDPFDGLHIAPSSSADIPDQQAVHLVLLSAEQTYKRDDEDSEALKTVHEYFETRGGSPRMYRNMIVFLAPDFSITEQLMQDMRVLLAWRSIEHDADSLNLDAAQEKEVHEAIHHYEDTISDRLQEAYCWLLVPTQDGTNPVKWNILRASGTTNPVAKAAQKLRENDLMVDQLSPKVLLMEMDEFDLWKGHEYISVRELCEDYARYTYLQRLKNKDVLFYTLEIGVKSSDYFGYADGQDDNGRYQGLCFGNCGYLQITPDGLLVKSSAALRQIESEKKEREPENNTAATISGNVVAPTAVSSNIDTVFVPAATSASTPILNTHFYGSVKLDPGKLGSTAGTINQEVLQHLSQLSGASVTVTLDIQVNIPNGIPEDVARTIRENCKTLKFDTSEFGQ